MRESPTKVTFNYSSNPPPPNHYSARLIQSGFVLGEPVALTDVPQLPPNYNSFSPKAARNRATTDFIVSSRRVDYEAPEPAQFAPPRPSFSRTKIPNVPQSVSLEEYNRLLYQYNTLQRRYNQLQERFLVLESEGRSPLHQSYGQGEIVDLIERYKINLLDEVKLLTDRCRLENKEKEMIRNSRRK